MLIIPVIDLSHGLVVHAKRGQRDTYQPITSVIADVPKPDAVLHSFLELYPFKIIYIADLDAIQHAGDHFQLINDLAKNNPDCEFWLDAGIESIYKKLTKFSSENIKHVLGSENKLPRHELTTIFTKNPELILSLDFINNELVENHYLLQDSSLWPRQVISMTLSRIGSNKGIDMECLNTILKLAEDNEIYAAGGVRNTDDLLQLQALNINGVLLATALHTGAITKEDLKQFYDE